MTNFTAIGQVRKVAAHKIAYNEVIIVDGIARFVTLCSTGEGVTRVRTEDGLTIEVPFGTEVEVRKFRYSK